MSHINKKSSTAWYKEMSAKLEHVAWECRIETREIKDESVWTRVMTVEDAIEMYPEYKDKILELSEHGKKAVMEKQITMSKEEIDAANIKQMLKDNFKKP